MAAKHHHDAPAAGVEGADDAVAKVFLGVGDLVGDALDGSFSDRKPDLQNVIFQICDRLPHDL